MNCYSSRYHSVDISFRVTASTKHISSEHCPFTASRWPRYTRYWFAVYDQPTKRGLEIYSRLYSGGVTYELFPTTENLTSTTSLLPLDLLKINTYFTTSLPSMSSQLFITPLQHRHCLGECVKHLSKRKHKGQYF